MPSKGENHNMHTVILCRPLHASGMALLEARHDVTIRTLNRPSPAGPRRGHARRARRSGRAGAG